MANVLMVFEPPDGGVAQHVMSLSLGLAERGHRVEVAGPARASAYASLEEAKIPVHRVIPRGYGHPRADRRAIMALVERLRTGEHQIVHCHSSKAGALGRLAGRRAGVRTVYTPHCFAFVGPVSRRRRAFATGVEWYLGHTATDAIVCTCKAEQRHARDRRLCPDERLHQIYYGVEPCPSAEPDPTLSALRAEGPVVGTVVVLREQKRVDLLVDAAPIVLERFPKSRIAIVGNGPLQDDLERQAAKAGLDTDRRFVMVPFTAPSARYLRALDLFVLPSAWEAMPIAVLEALACGVPQVATDVEGTGEATVEETGLLVAPGDHEALADAICALLSDDERRAAMAAASSERHAKLFDVGRMVDETASLYERLVKG